jgi:hypothetical protein
MSASVSGISDTISLMAAWVAAESEAKSGVEGARRSRRIMVSTPILSTQSTPVFVLSSKPLQSIPSPSMHQRIY